jgi:sporulation protein YlmC with PRC-barrel domain
MASYTDNAGREVATDETDSLIAASKVNGTSVYNTAGDNLGSIYDVMIDKVSGQVSYAVLSFGGFLGIGEDYYPMPWSMLTYDTGQGGYVVDIDKDRLEGAPSYGASEMNRWADPNYGLSIDEFYGVNRLP